MRNPRKNSHLPPTEMEALGLDLRQLMWLEHKHLGHLLAAHHLTVPQFLVLVRLAGGPEGCAIGRLADEMLQSYPTMTGIVDRLEKERLVERRRGDGPDRRQVWVGLTASGRALLARAERAQTRRVCQVLGKLHPEDLAKFRHLLQVFLKAFRSEFEKENG